MGAIPFVHLTAHSSFSLLQAMPSIKKLAKAAAADGHLAIGVTEMGNLFSAVECSKHLAAAGVQPILGAEVPIWLPQELGKPRRAAMVTLLVQNREGWINLCQLISLAQASKRQDGLDGTTLEALTQHASGLICLTGGTARGYLPQVSQPTASATLTTLQQAFGNRLYVELQRNTGQPNPAQEAPLLALAKAHQLPLVATHDVRFLMATDVTACEALLAIGDSTTLDDPNRRRLSPAQHLQSPQAMAELWADIPSAAANTVAIAQRCAYLLPATSVKDMFMPKWQFSGDTPTSEVITDYATKGLQKRLKEEVHPHCADQTVRDAATETYTQRLTTELAMIIKMGFDGYFLITSDFIIWAKQQGIPVGPGRGSGAGSLVAWALQITDLDPIKWELYFERFLNPERVSLPDFDIDFCQDRRHEVIAYVQQRFGADKVSQIITFGTLKARACLRDVGRVLGMPYGKVGEIAGFIPEGPNPPPIKDALAQDERLKARYDTEEDVAQLIDIAQELEGCYRHASTHAAGVMISDRNIAQVCGLYVDPRTDMPATQLSMFDAEYAGLVKFDFLGLKTLSVITMAERIIRATAQNEADKSFTINRISLNDVPTFTMLKQGHTLGIFQVEGAGMTELTKRMKADDMEALSALVALYRPGPLQTGMVDDYVNCRLGRKEAAYPHPVLEGALAATFGVPVYQEQIMQMARDMAGYTLGGADMLRRAMGKKKPEEMAKERSKFVAGAEANHGINAEDSNRVFDLMSGFAEYGFNKAHSMAYALISYQTAYLKANHFLAFMAASMTYERGNTDKLLQYKQDLQRAGHKLLPPCVNHSRVMFAVEGGHIRHALAALKGAGEEAMRKLVTEREAGGPYTSIWNVLARNDPQTLAKRQLEVLIKAGAFDVLHADRAYLLHNVDILLAYAHASFEARTSGQSSLFGDATTGTLDPAPFASTCKPPPTVDPLAKLALEQEAVGFYLTSHPLESFAPDLARLSGFKGAHEIEAFGAAGGGSCRLAGLIMGRREVRTKAGNRMAILAVSSPTGQTEIVVFPEMYKDLGNQLQIGKPLVFSVKVQQDGERLRISLESYRPLEDVLQERPEIHLQLKTPEQLGHIQQLLGSAGRGPTRVRLRLPTSHGGAVMRLPQGIALSATLIANLKTMGLMP